MEHQLLKLDQQNKQQSNHSQNNNNSNNKEFDSTSTETTSDVTTLDSLKLHTVDSSSRTIDSQSYYKSLVKQMNELKNANFALQNQLEKRNEEYEKLCVKYAKRKSRHRERLFRLK